jgi:hypothetical protein
VTTRPVLANNGAMSQFIGAFEVTSKLSGQEFRCRFSHMWNGIATRHADTIDTKFFVGGEALVVGLAHTSFVTFRERTGRDLTDREASYVAAEFLRERLEESEGFFPSARWILIRRFRLKHLERRVPQSISPYKMNHQQHQQSPANHYRDGNLQSELQVAQI